jgi:hypothetical protein
MGLFNPMNGARNKSLRQPGFLSPALGPEKLPPADFRPKGAYRSTEMRDKIPQNGQKSPITYLLSRICE